MFVLRFLTRLKRSTPD
uniref:Uncharacterized protein n=1 Tax=Anguilla anguilla TaxID=7936 RepID=A0A0E9QHP5_ANGAN